MPAIRIILTVWLFCCGSYAGATESESLHDRTLDSLRRELQRLDLQMQGEQTAEDSASARLDAAEKRLVLHQELITEQRLALAALEDTILAIEAELAPHSAEIQLLEDRAALLKQEQTALAYSLSRTLLAERRLKSWSILEFLLNSRSWRDLMARRALLERIEDLERRSLSTVKTAHYDVLAAQHQAGQSVQRLYDRLQDLQDSHTRSFALNTELAATVTQLRLEQDSLRANLATLQQDQRLLDRRRREVIRAEARIQDLISQLSAPQPASMVMPGLAAKSLPWPCAGRLAQRYGPVRNADLATVTESPGIEIVTADAADVTAVASGRVSSVTWLRGFGNVCILEHPGSIYTVYARLGQIVVRPSEEVASGTRLGNAGFDATTADYRVHFEIWSGKEKKDPLDWLIPR